MRSDAAGRAERPAIDPHPLERRRLELERDLARRRAQRRPAVVALPDRLRQALQAAAMALGLLERRLQALDLARLLGGRALGAPPRPRPPPRPRSAAAARSAVGRRQRLRAAAWRRASSAVDLRQLVARVG